MRVRVCVSVLLKETLPSNHEDSLYFPPEDFFVLFSALRSGQSLLGTELCVSCEGVEFLFLPHVDTQLSQHILLQSLSTPRCSAVVMRTSSDRVIGGHFWTGHVHCPGSLSQHRNRTVFVTVAVD